MITKYLTLKDVEVEVLGLVTGAIPAETSGGVPYPPEPQRVEIRRIFLERKTSEHGGRILVDVLPFLTAAQLEEIEKAFLKEVIDDDTE